MTTSLVARHDVKSASGGRRYREAALTIVVRGVCMGKDVLMVAYGIKAFGDARVLQALDIASTAPGAGEVRVKVMFAGVNGIDVHARQGNYLGAQPLTAPLVLGYEGAGEIEAVGRDVGGLKVGDRVAWCGVPGSLAEYQVVPAWRVMVVPDDMPLDIACALQLDGALAHALTVSAFPVRGGDQVLVQGAEAVQGQMLVQVARALGAIVIGTVASEAAAGLAWRLGPIRCWRDRTATL